MDELLIVLWKNMPRSDWREKTSWYTVSEGCSQSSREDTAIGSKGMLAGARGWHITGHPFSESREWLESVAWPYSLPCYLPRHPLPPASLHNLPHSSTICKTMAQVWEYTGTVHSQITVSSHYSLASWHAGMELRSYTPASAQPEPCPQPSFQFLL